jgi:hypothetical protein
MLPHFGSDLRVLGLQVKEQVVVKFKSTEPARRSLRALAASETGTRESTSPRGTLESVLAGEHLISMEPLFPEPSARRTAFAERLVMAVEPAEDDGLAGLNVLQFESHHDAESAAELLQKDNRVEYAHVVVPRFLCAKKKPIPGKKSDRKLKRKVAAVDPLKNRQWGLTAVELTQAQQSAGFTEATSIVIGVIDSGVDSAHPDLQGVIFDEQNFTSGPLQDTSGHGTHVCGIIAAVRNNRIGISGVCQSRRLMSLKALSPYDVPGYYRAIRYATEKGAQVVNFSLGGDHDPTEQLLIQRAIAKGVVIVAAMGNDFLRGNPTSYPAAIPDVISVGASTEVDRRASFSGTGAHIDLVAPGDNILSTVPTYPSSLADETHYDAWPGTSMATPFVTATVALLLAKRPNASLATIVDALRAGADLIDGQAGFTQQLGYGRLNIRKALARI